MGVCALPKPHQLARTRVGAAEWCHLPLGTQHTYTPLRTPTLNYIDVYKLDVRWENRTYCPCPDMSDVRAGHATGGRQRL